MVRQGQMRRIGQISLGFPWGISTKSFSQATSRVARRRKVLGELDNRIKKAKRDLERCRCGDTSQDRASVT